jgi:pimeloyl-ACP methyl ester carboxylesterase
VIRALPRRWAILLAVALLAALPFATDRERQPLDDAARATAPGRFVALSQGQVHHELAGPAGAPLVVFVHGFSTPSYVWDAVLPPLRQAGFRTLRFDLYGRGFSDRPRVDGTGELFAGQTIELLDRLGETRPVALVGLSMGGGIAALTAARHPERVSRLVLMAPSGFLKDPSPTARLMQTPLVGEYLVSLAGDRMLEGGQGENVRHPERHAAFFARFAEQMPYRGFKRSLLSSLRHLVFRDLAAEYRTLGRRGLPVLLVWGRDDAVIPAAHAEDVRRCVPQAEVHLLDDTGHLAPVEQPEATSRSMLAFLQGAGGAVTPAKAGETPATPPGIVHAAR